MLGFTLSSPLYVFCRTTPTCRRSRSARGRAEKRGLLYDAMAAYADHFCPALDAEFSAEQDSAVKPKTRNTTLNQQDRLYSAIVFSLHPTQRLRAAEFLAVSVGNQTAMATALLDTCVAAPVGSPAARTLSEFASSGARVSIVPAINSLPYERAIAAVQALTKPGPSAGEITRLIVASFVDTPEINTNDLQQFRTKAAGRWFDLARETVVSVKQEELNRAVKQMPLNPSQRDAARRALRARLTLIQGPPGTGKTLTAAHFIAASVALRTGPVLACAGSNVATDNLLQKVRKVAPRANIVRIGRISATAEDQWSICLDCLLERNGAVRQARDALQRGELRTAELVDLERRVTTAILRKADVVVSTCVSCGREELKGLDFPVVVVDEATQVTEPDVLISLTATAKVARQVILVGDHHQLPPTVLSDGNGARLKVSLFLRLWGCGVGCEFLDVQYRMHPHIARFPAKYFYFGQLRNGISEKERTLPRTYARLTAMALNDANHVLFCDVCTGKEERDSSVFDTEERDTSFINRKEVEIVTRIVDYLQSESSGEKYDSLPRIGVISPYAAQVRLLRDAMKERDGHSIEVSTVDAFQGREKDVIVLSIVRSNPNASIGFLRDWRRLNVAITRARLLLAVVGHRQTIAAGAHWAAWLAMVSGQGGVITEAAIRSVSDDS